MVVGARHRKIHDEGGRLRSGKAENGHPVGRNDEYEGAEHADHGESRLNAPIRSPFRIALLVEVIGPGAFEELDEEQADETGRDQQGGGPLGLRELFLRLDDCARQIVGVLLKRGGPIRLALVSRLLHFAEHPLVVALELLHPRTLLRAQVAPQTLAERDEGEKLQDGEQAEDSPHAAGAGPERPGESGGPIEGPHRPVGGLDSRESLGVVGAIHSAESLDRLAEVESGIRRRRSRTDGALGAGRHYASSSRRKRPCTIRSRIIAQKRIASPARRPSPLATYWSATTTS